MSELYVIIDKTDLIDIKIKGIADRERALLLGRIFKADKKDIVVPPLENKAFSIFEKINLQYLYWNLTNEIPSEDYSELINKIKNHVATFKPNNTPLNELQIILDSKSLEKEKIEEPNQIKEKEIRKPKANTTMGLGWQLADELLGNYPIPSSKDEWKQFRTALIKSCENQGIKTATATAVYSQWKNFKLGEEINE